MSQFAGLPKTEQVFSQMQLVKTNLTNEMQLKMINTILAIW